MSRQMQQATTLYESFREAQPKELIKLRVDVPRVCAAIGHVESINYRTTHGGKVELYRHDFQKGSRPLLCASPNGKQLLLLGGRYQFTDRGIVDKDSSGKLIFNPKHGRAINPRKRKNPVRDPEHKKLLTGLAHHFESDEKALRKMRKNPEPAHICPICNKSGGSHVPDALRALGLPGEYAHPRCVQKGFSKSKGVAPANAHVYKKIFYFETMHDAKAYALTHGFPVNRIIPYQRGWAIQLRVSGPYVGNPKSAAHKLSQREFAKYCYYWRPSRALQRKAVKLYRADPVKWTNAGLHRLFQAAEGKQPPFLHHKKNNPKKPVKGYIAWNYWDHKILLRTTSWQKADAAVTKARKDNPGTPANWFGLEAVENIHANALNREELIE
jgi:hypothetical protein